MATANNELENKTDALEAEVSMDAGDDLEIEVVDDTPPKDRGRKPLDKEVADPTDEEIEDYSAGVKKRIKELTHARHDERRRAETLERERNELQQFAERLLHERKSIEQRFNAGAVEYGKVALESAEGALAKAKSDLRAAHEAFDTEAIVNAQEALASATLRVERAKSYRPPEVAASQERDIDVQPRQAQQQIKPDAKSLSWQARNQWFGTDEEATSFALGLHQKLVKSGVDPKSDDYYEQIDARMKSKFPELFDEDGEIDDKPTKPQKKPTNVVAPATRTPAGPGKVRLSSTQVALAKRLGLTNQQYAAQVLKLQKES